MFFRSIITALAICAPLAAQAQDAPQTVTVTLTSYAFAPSALVLKVGVPVHLHLVNDSGKGHSFSAPEFFAASAVAPDDQARVKRGAIDLDGGASADIILTPGAPGSYPLECTHFLHSSMGMKGSITVQ